ncbi:class I lanthipeptide [Ulvibacterium marinum]|uniref:class I lanthipeptide n=1 Tax=Ulvibacterium marinum TaxID=2419782 RepID=UPI001B8652E6
MKKKKELSLSLNKKKVSELNRSSQRQIQGGYCNTFNCPTCNCGPTHDCTDFSKCDC